MAQVLIRNLDDQVVAVLKKQADAAGLSLEAFLREALTSQATAGRAELVAEIEAMRLQVKPPAPGEPRSEDIVREMRDERSRGQRELLGLGE